MLRIFYDGECPFCSRYVKMLRLSKSGQVQLVDLRENEAAKVELEQLGFDLDQGMVVEDEGRRYGGSDAVAYLAPLTTPSDALNKINRAALLEQNPDKSLTFEMNGKTYRNQNAETLADDIEERLHPAWFRKWFHFQPVHLGQPEPCNV